MNRPVSILVIAAPLMIGSLTAFTLASKTKKAGLVETKGGLEGGYHSLKDAASVTLRQVLAAVEIPVVAAGWQSGDVEMICLVASGMPDIMNDIYTDLDTLCRSRLEEITILVIDRKIFG